MQRIKSFNRCVLVLCALLSGATSLKTQSITDKMPPSPTAASIIKAGEINANKFTGTPSISIPLYNVSFHNMSVPIALSYNAGGIRVDDVPGWVGTNWSLSAGGVITRSVRGLADDFVIAGYFNTRPQYEAAGLTKVADLKAYDQGEMDGHPDIYNFNFPGGSGKFMIDHNKKIHVFPFQKMKIEFLTGTTVDGGFKITTLDGTTYTFDAVEYMQVSANGNLPGDLYVSSWYLSKIENPIYVGKEITFSYIDLPKLSNIVKLKSYSATRYYHGGGYFPANQQTVVNDRFGSYETKRLIGIQWEGGSVNFIANTERLDLTGDNHLDSIVVKNDGGTTIREYAMTYGYYGGENKLRLDKVQEFGQNEAPKPPHIFTYEGSDLPDYNSTGQDYWGYYNGKDSNLDLLPEQWVKVDESYPGVTFDSFYRIGSADRQPVAGFLKRGILQTITYPTGGTSEFQMESNRYANKVSDLLPVYFQSEMSCGLANVRCDFVNDFDYLVNTFGNQILNKATDLVQSEGGGDAPFFTQTKTLLVVDAQRVVFDIDIEAHGQNYTTTLPFVKLEKQNGANWDLVFNVSGASNSTKIEDLAVGTYRMTSYAEDEFGPETDKAKIRANWYVPTGITDLYGPGLRVKRISQRETPGGPETGIRKYEYTDESGASSGLLYNEPIHAYRKHSMFEENLGQFFRPLLKQSSGSLFQHFESPIGYGRVTEIFGENGENGKVIDLYNTNPESILDFVGPDYYEVYAANEHPFAPSFYATWSLGQLLESTVYRKKNTGESGADYKRAQHTKNTYHYERGDVIRGLGIAQVNVIVDDASTVPVDLSGGMVYDEINYGFTPIWEQLLKTEQTIFSNEEIGQTTVTELTYETTPKHFQVKAQSIINSDGKKNIAEYTYPADYSTAHPFAGYLDSMFMHANAIEELSILEQDGNREIIGGKITNYDVVAHQPKEVYVLKVSTPIAEANFLNSLSHSGSTFHDSRYEKRIDLKYEAGNLVEQQLVGGSPLTYLWGYHNQYPVAQIQNATYADVVSALGGGVINLNGVGLDSIQEGNLRAIPNSFVTTYTFLPGIGMNLQKGPNALKTTYFYDPFGRLKIIKDHEGNIINTYKYHLKGQ